MSSKYKSTGCLKFFLLLIILAPLAYMGASYYNGQDGWANLKGLFMGGESRSSAGTDRSKQEFSIEQLQEENESLRREIEQLEQSLKECQNKKEIK